MSERWLPVVGYEGKYEVSDLGRVRSLFKGSRYGSFPRDEPLILTPTPNTGGGHLRVKLTKEGHTLTALVHVLVLTAFRGAAPAGHEGCHDDGDPENNVLGNLLWKTHEANMQDMVRHGRSRRGEKGIRVRLTEDQAREIKRRLKSGTRRRQVSVDLSIDFGLVDNIARGRAWAWLTV